MRFGLCTDIRNVLEVQEVGFDYIDGKLNQFALWSQEDFDSVLERFRQASIRMERCSLLFPKTMVVIGERYNEAEMRSYLETAFCRMDALGCKLVVFGSGKSRIVPEGMRWQDAYRQLVAVTRIIGEIAAKHGICVAIEPLNRAETNFINRLMLACPMWGFLPTPTTCGRRTRTWAGSSRALRSCTHTLR